MLRNLLFTCRLARLAFHPLRALAPTQLDRRRGRACDCQRIIVRRAAARRNRYGERVVADCRMSSTCHCIFGAIQRATCHAAAVRRRAAFYGRVRVDRCYRGSADGSTCRRLLHRHLVRPLDQIIKTQPGWVVGRERCKIILRRGHPAGKSRTDDRERLAAARGSAEAPLLS